MTQEHQGPGDERVLAITIDAPMERVWAEITKTGRIQRALYNTILETDLTPGSRMRYYSPDKKRVFVIGEVLEVVPPRRLVHTYMNTLHDDPPTTVAWELENVEGGCRVTLTHGGWTQAHKTADKSAAGWKEILALLKSEVETGTIPGKTRLMYRIMGWFQFALPKRTRVEHADRMGW